MVEKARIINNHKAVSPSFLTQSYAAISITILKTLKSAMSITVGKTVNFDTNTFTSNDIVRAKHDVYVLADHNMTIYDGGEVYAGRNLFVFTPKLTVKNDAIIQSDGNVFLFAIQGLECIDGIIDAGANLYLPAKRNIHLNNCDIYGESIKYIDRSNSDSICNAEYYSANERLQEYCDNFVSSFNHDEL